MTETPTTPPVSRENMRPLIPAVADQIAALRLEQGRPILAVDADEVLFYFMRGFERFLAGQALFFDWRSYALHGNIRRQTDREALPADAIQPLLNDFFAASTALLDPVTGAADALASLASKAQIVVLSNLPVAFKAAREQALAIHGMPYPLIANSGPKGPAMLALMARAGKPAVFIDDIPHHHASVAKVAPETLRLHYVADPRLGALLGAAADCHCRFDDWPAMAHHVTSALD